jgi:hypothetical protein
MDAIVETKTEDGLDAFKRVVSKRVNRILGDLALIEQMAGGSRYKYSLDEVETILGAITTAADRVGQRFTLMATKVSAEEARKSFHF